TSYSDPPHRSGRSLPRWTVAVRIARERPTSYESRGTAFKGGKGSPLSLLAAGHGVEGRWFSLSAAAHGDEGKALSLLDAAHIAEGKELSLLNANRGREGK